ncbi:unnamed protein product [Auanema sp. JU1783]|nr:unnamed protein product [Auanema sp. JU1783]
MRFSALFSDQGSVEIFNKCIGAVSHLSKKKCAIKITPAGMCFICNTTTGVNSKDGDYWCGVLIAYSPTFLSYSFAGLAEDKNEIILEINVDDLARCLQYNQHNSPKIKLANKNNSPHLRVELRQMNIVHDIPVTIIQSRKWPLYDCPSMDEIQCCLYLPPTRVLLRVLKSLKNTHTKYVSLRANNEGELQLHAAMKHGECNVFFTDLQNETIANPNTEQQWIETKLHVKPLHEFFNQFSFTHSRIKLSLLSSRMAEFSVCQEEFEVSFVLGEIRE